MFRMDRAHHHNLPTSLAIADKAGLALGGRVKLDDFLDKPRLGLADVLDRLARHRVMQKADEIARVAGCERDADFTVVLHPADAGTMPRARVEDDERTLGLVDDSARRRNDPHQPVIDRTP